MELTRKQEEGLRLCIARYKARDAYTCIAGYAGTGKSTLVQFIAAALGLDPEEDVCYIAYTGKAALVLQEKGCPNAMTAHKLLYKSFRGKDGNYYHQPRAELEHYWKLIILDEVSMIPKSMWELLLSHGIPVIACGDPGQLPPVSSSDANGILDHPHVFLDEIMRQALDNEIIKLSMDIREGKPLKYMDGKDVKIIHPEEVVDGMFSWADQMICATNNTRRDINIEARKVLLGAETEAPIVGDKIICLKNHWNTINANGDVFVNGLLGQITRAEKLRKPKIGYVFNCDFTVNPNDPTLENTFMNIDMDYNLFMEGKETITAKNFRIIPSKFHPYTFDYGYCITCWKSQGSQFDKVLVFQEDYFPREAELKKQFLYTAATRAVKKLVIVKGW